LETNPLKIKISNDNLTPLVDALLAKQVYVISCHINPECDALGSQYALASLLRRHGKTVYMVDPDPVPEEFRFLPESASVMSPDDISKIEYDAVITVDCSGEDRLGELFTMYHSGVYINIDHHISNTEFANVNWVDAKASSASEMIYRLFKFMQIDFTRQEAEAIYAGIVNDTGCFRYPNTTVYTHQAVADLLSVSIDGYKIYQDIFESRTFEQIKVTADTLATLQSEAEGRLVWMRFSPLGIRDEKPLYDISDEVLNVARQIRQAEVFLLFKPAGQGMVRINFRSRGKIDVNNIAQFFGGGGHKTASGCKIEGDMEDIIARVIDYVKGKIYEEN